MAAWLPSARPPCIPGKARWKWALSLEKPQTFTLAPGVPGWCKQFHLSVNGVATAPNRKQRLPGHPPRVARGDTITYRMEMPIQTVYRQPAVRHLKGAWRSSAGRVVYSAWKRRSRGIILDRMPSTRRISRPVPRGTAPRPAGRGGGVQGGGRDRDQGWRSCYRSEPPKESENPAHAVHTAVGDNREPGEMRVWIRTK